MNKRSIMPNMNKKAPGSPGSWDVKAAINLRFKNGLSYSKIARQLSAPVSSIHKALKPLEAILKNQSPAVVYESNKADILSVIEFELASQLMNRKKIKKASLNNIAYSFKMVNDVNRLERMLPTSISLDLSPQLAEMLEEITGRMAQGRNGAKIAPITNNYLIEDKTKCTSTLLREG